MKELNWRLLDQAFMPLADLHQFEAGVDEGPLLTGLMKLRTLVPDAKTFLCGTKPASENRVPAAAGMAIPYIERNMFTTFQALQD